MEFPGGRATGTMTPPIILSYPMKQTSFSDAEFASKKELTRRERLLAEIEAAMPWAALVAALLPYYPKGDGHGRLPMGLEGMLRIYCAQQCFGLSDEGIEDAIYDSQSIRGFVGIDLTHESSLDATTLLKFRELLETHNLTRRVFDEINVHLASKGMVMLEGTVVDATLIAAPPSTKNRDKERDPEMHQSPHSGSSSSIVSERRLSALVRRRPCVAFAPIACGTASRRVPW